MWRSRTFWRLFAAYGGFLVAAVFVLGAVLAARVESFHRELLNQALQRQAILVREVSRGIAPSQFESLQLRMSLLAKEIDTRITLLDADGRVLADSEEDPAAMNNHLNRPEVEESRLNGFGDAIRPSETLGQSMMYVALRARLSNGIEYVRLAIPLNSVQQQMSSLQRILWTSATIVALAAMAIAYWLARSITRPLQELAQGAERLATGDYGSKVYVTGQDESFELAESFNHMSERLAMQFSQLQEDRQQLRTILSGMVEGVIAIDGSQRILFVNDRAAELLGFATTSSVGRRLWEIVRQRAFQEIVDRSLESSEACRGELSWGDGASVKHLTIHAAKLPGSPSRGAVLVLHDTTELRRLERLRQEFVANVSHELKTPLAVIKACCETLIDGAADDVLARGTFLQQIADQGERLYSLILDLISLARIESGVEAFQFEAIDLGHVVGNCLERHRARAESKQQTLVAIGPGQQSSGSQFDETDLASSAGTGVALMQEAAAWADEEAVHQILDNLVDNAVKYTPAGGHIRVGWGAEDGQVFVQISDDGIGIPTQDLPRIFERFYRVDKARSREQGGTGLGLSIVKHLVQAMRGTIQATSEPGKGTTFRVRLPQSTAS